MSILYRKLVLATAWQESCWRQYIIKNKKIEPLRSDTGDVGLMQVNEKVWRGFYDIQKLRWDIAYNSRAGAEILLNYLVRHALKQGEQKRPGGLDNLARSSYSAYNGGPGQFSRYRNRGVASAHKKVDAAFWEKYQQVIKGKELNVAHCLGAEPAEPTPSPQAAKPPKQAVSAKKNKGAVKSTASASGAADARWVLAQRDDHFTLQLAQFSTRESARKFVSQHALSGRIGIVPIQKGNARLFAVLYGSYAKRTDADRAKQKLKHFKPWVRRFAEVRTPGR